MSKMLYKISRLSGRPTAYMMTAFDLASIIQRIAGFPSQSISFLYLPRNRIVVHGRGSVRVRVCVHRSPAKPERNGRADGRDLRHSGSESRCTCEEEEEEAPSFPPEFFRRFPQLTAMTLIKKKPRWSQKARYPFVGGGGGGHLYNQGMCRVLHQVVHFVLLTSN